MGHPDIFAADRKQGTVVAARRAKYRVWLQTWDERNYRPHAPADRAEFFAAFVDLNLAAAFGQQLYDGCREPVKRVRVMDGSTSVRTIG